MEYRIVVQKIQSCEFCPFLGTNLTEDGDIINFYCKNIQEHSPIAFEEIGTEYIITGVLPNCPLPVWETSL